ncbi:hypothetical protein FKM82_015404 [Ascaphus truei]
MDTETLTALEPPEPPKVLSASPEALDFISHVGLEELQLCMFTESLLTISDSGKELGSFTVSVQPGHYEIEGFAQDKCFLVHATSQGTIDDTPCGTSVFAYISQKLETLEQHHYEYLKMKGHSLDKKTHMLKQGDRLVIDKVITEGEKVQQETTSHDLSTLTGFISEAANLLIMRLLARRRSVPPNMSFLTFDAERNLCTTTYSELGSRSQMIGKETVEVYGIERTVQSEDIPTTWHCYFLTDGHLASRVQIGSPVTMKCVQMPVLSEPDEEDPKPVFEKKPLDWSEDPELYSEFLDRKEELIAGHETYIRHHPEMKILMGDFMQFLLLREPEDTLTFAAEYFAPFSTTQEQGDSFRSSSRSSPFRSSSRSSPFSNIFK